MKVGVSILLVVFMALVVSCGNDDTPENIEPNLIIGDAVNVTRSEATLTGQVVLKGNTSLSDLYFMYGTTTDMEMRSDQATLVNGNVSFTLTGLVSNTQYYYCLCGGNGRVTLRTDSRSFTTQPGDKPVIGSLSVLSQGSVSVVVGYDITDTGGETITETGCYVVEAGGSETAKVVCNEQIVDGETCKVRVTGLKQNTEYEITAYAVNRNGESQSTAMRHTTSPAITVYTAGTLSQVMSEDEINSQTLCIAGQINGDDIRFLRQILGGETADVTVESGIARNVDLTDVKIITGGSTYDGEHFSEEDVVGIGMFSNCANLKSLVLPDDVTKISHNSMENCTSLESVTIPATATTVASSAGCTALKNITVSPMNTNYKSIDGVLFDAEGKKLVWYPVGKSKEYTIPSDVSALLEYSFLGYKATSLTIPDNVTEIGRLAFYGASLETVTLSSNLQTIATGTFQGCSKLATVYLGANTALINDYAFDKCPLASLHVAAEYTPVCSEKAFSSPDGDVYSLCTLYVPTGSKSMYRNHDVWGKFKSIVEE